MSPVTAGVGAVAPVALRLPVTATHAVPFQTDNTFVVELSHSLPVEGVAGALAPMLTFGTIHALPFQIRSSLFVVLNHASPACGVPGAVALTSTPRGGAIQFKTPAPSVESTSPSLPPPTSR